MKSFSHIFYIGAVPNVFMVHPSVPARTMAEFTSWLKAQKDSVPFGSGGVGSIGHIVGEIFKNNAGVQMTHVPYKGSSPMHSNLLGGTIKVAVDSLAQNIPYMKSGQLRLLAVTSRERMSQRGLSQRGELRILINPETRPHQSPQPDACPQPAPRAILGGMA